MKREGMFHVKHGAVNVLEALNEALKERRSLKTGAVPHLKGTRAERKRLAVERERRRVVA